MMQIVVIGCGRVGADLAFRLFQRGHQVTVIDNHAKAFFNLDPEYHGRTVEGEALNRDVLQRAGLSQAEGLAAVTNSDTLNCVVGHLARTVYEVPYVVARNYDPRWRTLHETFGLQVVSSSSWGAQRIEELLYHVEMRAVFSAGNGEVEVYEFAVPRQWEGRKLAELIQQIDCAPVALTRAGRARLPEQDATLQREDIVHLSATLDGIESIRRRLGEDQKG